MFQPPQRLNGVGSHRYDRGQCRIWLLPGRPVNAVAAKTNVTGRNADVIPMAGVESADVFWIALPPSFVVARAFWVVIARHHGVLVACWMLAVDELFLTERCVVPRTPRKQSSMALCVTVRRDANYGCKQKRRQNSAHNNSP